MNRTKLSLPRRRPSAQISTHDGELSAQTIAAEFQRVHGESFDIAAVASELACSDETAEALGECLMPRGQRFHVRRVLTHIAAYLRIDPAKLRDLLGRGDAVEPAVHERNGFHGADDSPHPRQPKVVVVQRRGVGRGPRSGFTLPQAGAGSH